MKNAVIVFLIIALFSMVIFAQTPANNDTAKLKQEANEFFTKQDWENASKAYEKIVALEEKNVGARYRLGISLLNLNKNSEAQTHLEKAFNTAPNPVFALVLARVYARSGDKTKMFEVTEKSTTLGGIAPENLTGEKDFVAFKDDQKFKDLVEKSDLVVNPCKAKPEFRQFDFWIGEWNAKNVQGVMVGSS